MLDRLTLQRLRDLPIEQVAERVGLHVERHKSLCPFHDDHRPSLTFHARSNTFRCFSCGARGGPIDLVMRRLGMSFPEACRWLDGGVRIDPLPLSRPRPRVEEEEAYKPFDAARYARFFEHPWLSDRARAFLFQERRLDPRVVAWCRLTSWTDRHGTHWLQTPYYDPQMRLVGLQNRNLDYRKSEPAEAQTENRTTSGMVSQIENRTDAQPTSEKENRTSSGKVCGPTSGGPAQANSVSHMAPATTRCACSSTSTIASPRPSTCIPTPMPRASTSSCSCATCCRASSTTICPRAARTSPTIISPSPKTKSHHERNSHPGLQQTGTGPNLLPRHCPSVGRQPPSRVDRPLPTAEPGAPRGGLPQDLQVVHAPRGPPHRPLPRRPVKLPRSACSASNTCLTETTWT